MSTREENINKVLELLHKDCRCSLEQIATMLDISIDEVAEIIDNLEKENVILGYGARINWDAANGTDVVTAYIELRVAPQRDRGFDRIAERIYQYPEVKAVNLMSGSYDFGITVEGKNIQEVSRFVSERLAPMESVMGTATHFVLKRYKYDGVICAKEEIDDREGIS